jgi:uncharacterized Zn-binding protein involved in type VI secretion
VNKLMMHLAARLQLWHATKITHLGDAPAPTGGVWCIRYVVEEGQEQMKKLVLLSVAALMVASSVFAPVAMAQKTLARGEIYSASVTYQPDSIYNLPVTVTIQCTEGSRVHAGAVIYEADHKKGPIVQLVSTGDSFTCETTGPQSVTVLLGLGNLTKKSKVWMSAGGAVCDIRPDGGDTNCTEGDVTKTERVKIP